MICKYCGTTLKQSTTGTNIPVWVGRFSQKCWQSPQGKHVACSGSAMVCKYCGTDVKSSTTGTNVPILLGRISSRCRSSPHGKHELPG